MIKVFINLLSALGGQFKKSDTEVIANVRQSVEEGARRCSLFYGVEITELPDISICTRDQYDKLYGRKTEEWGVGASTLNGLLFIDPRRYKNTAPNYGLIAETDHVYSVEQFTALVGHEVGHICFSYLLGMSGHDADKMFSWLNEGCQQIASGQVSPESRSTKSFSADILDGRSVNYFYYNSATAVAKMVRVFGQGEFSEKLRALLKRIGQAFKDRDSGKESDLVSLYRNSFKELFGFELTKGSLENFVKG